MHQLFSKFVCLWEHQSPKTTSQVFFFIICPLCIARIDFKQNVILYIYIDSIVQDSSITNINILPYIYLTFQAPSNMKSVLQAGWLFTVAVGNIIVLIVAEVAQLPDQVGGALQTGHIAERFWV